MWSLKETPRETQEAAESFVPANAVLFILQGLLNHQPSATGVPRDIKRNGLKGVGQPMSERTSRVPSFSDRTANIVQRQIARVRF